MDGDLLRGLISRGVDVVSASASGMVQREDEDHLAFATAEGRALYSFNVGDFQEIHTLWVGSGRRHAGLVLSQQKRYSVGEQIRRLAHLMNSISAAEMRNRVEFLGRW